MNAKLRRIADYLLAAKDAADVAPRAIGVALLPHLFILEIERLRAAAPPRLCVRLAGTELGRTFRRALEGHYMEEFLHGPRGDDVMAGFRECADSRAPVWMRQVIRLPQKAPHCVEGIAVYLAPERIYGGLIVGHTPDHPDAVAFEKAALV